MHEVTMVLRRVQEGDQRAAAELLPLVYDDLRRLAARKLTQESPGQTLQPTALVHEAYLRVAGELDESAAFDHRGHFFAAAAQAMRRILVDNARRKHRLKRGGPEAQREEFDEQLAAVEVREDLQVLDEALQRLEHQDPTAAKVVNMRYFTGLSLPEIAGILDISPRTADRLWSYARAWLRRELEQ